MTCQLNKKNKIPRTLMKSFVHQTRDFANITLNSGCVAL